MGSSEVDWTPGLRLWTKLLIDLRLTRLQVGSNYLEIVKIVILFLHAIREEEHRRIVFTGWKLGITCQTEPSRFELN